MTTHPDWPLKRPLAGIATAIAASLAYTVWAEWRNVYVQGNWAYADAMPTIGGIGVAPLMQWSVLPVLALLWMRKSGERSSVDRRWR